MPSEFRGESLSQRQIQLIQGTASILMEQLSLTREEAISIITESLREELKASNVSFEFLEIGTISYRQAFIRKLVDRVEIKIIINKNLPQQKIKAAINNFIQMLYESWKSQS
jgi:hypothetical protein